jgi:hypothetical protein
MMHAVLPQSGSCCACLSSFEYVCINHETSMRSIAWIGSRHRPGACPAAVVHCAGKRPTHLAARSTRGHTPAAAGGQPSGALAAAGRSCCSAQCSAALSHSPVVGRQGHEHGSLLSPCVQQATENRTPGVGVHALARRHLPCTWHQHHPSHRGTDKNTPCRPLHINQTC